MDVRMQIWYNVIKQFYEEMDTCYRTWKRKNEWEKRGVIDE